jgi:Cu/Ag efflux protein CusF
MKKIIQYCYIVSLLYCLLTSSFVIAQTSALDPSITSSAFPTVVDKDIQLLKDKIANKVSEIRKQNNKAISGFVLNIDGNTMKLSNDGGGEVSQVKFDDTLTKVFRVLGATKKEIKIDDIAKNDYTIVSGVVADNIITANVVLIDENFLVDSGKITEINKETYNIKVLTSDKNTYSLDIETSTKQYMVNIKTLLRETIGFSKLKEGDTVHFVVKKTFSEKNNNYSAVKILIIPQEYFIK